MNSFRSRGNRRRRLRLPVQRDGGGDAGWIFVPGDPATSGDADDPLYLGDTDAPAVPTFAEAAGLALELVSSGLIAVEALVLLDERRRMVGVLCDVPGELGLMAGTVEFAGVEPFCQVIDVVVRDHIVAGPPSDDDRGKFEALTAHMRGQGLLLLDVILANADMLQSLSIACDPDSVWFEPFEPLSLRAG